MKLIIAVVQNDDADAVIDSLLDSDFRATRLASTGGFLRRGNTTIMIGVQDQQVDQVLDLVRQQAHARAQQEQTGEIQTAAATVFVLDLEDYQRL
ncbi:MAG TPA: cyclic-di-AMP receptor [Thermomicrobiaceae bacterium]|nr:cyclic-di-AMP receptor [Thermomicrobiaceae bacterium]